MSEQPFYMHNLDSSVNDHQQPSSFQNASGRTGLRLVLPPLSAVKALKGKKKGSRGVAFQEPKAPRPVKLKPLKEVLTKLIAQINKKDDYAFFLEPVNPAQVPGYADIIKNPMDFGTISQKVSKGKYRSLEEFGNDVRLVTGNAKLFNPPGTIYHSEAERIEQYAVDHINRAAASVIEYEGDWNIDGEVDEGQASGQGEDGRGTPMDIDGSSRARSPSVASVQAPAVRRVKGKKEPGTVSESIESDGHLPGHKDGVGVFPPDSHWSELMLSLKLKGKRYRTKKERMRIERSGPPYALDGSLDYTEVEDPFSILSVFLPEQPTKPTLTPLYPSNDPNFPGPSAVPFNRQVYVDLEPSPYNPPSRKRKHWSIQRNAPSRRRDATNDGEEDIPSWKAPREHHACDYGAIAILQEQLAREYGLSNVSLNLGSEPQLFTAIRQTVDRGVPPNPAHTKDDMDLTEEGYWKRRGRLAEDYMKDLVYGGVDGLAYIRSLAEFVSKPETEIVEGASSSTLGMPLAQYIEETVIDSITEGRHRLVREASERLRDPTRPVHAETAARVDFSLHTLPQVARQLVELRKVYAQQIDMAALLRKRDELFLTDDDWAGKQYAEVQKQKRLEEQKRSEAEKERALADGSAHPMQYLRFAIQSHEEAQNSEASPVDSTGMLQYALNYSADLILQLAKGKKRERDEDVKMEGADSHMADEDTEEPVLKKLRLQLLASAKRAPIDLISDLPPELVPERLREEIESHRNVQSRVESSSK